MKKIVPLRTSDQNVVYVEMDEIEFLGPAKKAPHENAISDQPEGSELTSAAEQAIDALKSLKGGLTDIAETIKDAIAASAPAAWKLEVNVGFKGKTSPIPILLSGEANAKSQVTNRMETVSFDNI